MSSAADRGECGCAADVNFLWILVNVVVLYLLAVATICNRAVAGRAFVVSPNLFVMGVLAAPRAIGWEHRYFPFL